MKLAERLRMACVAFVSVMRGTADAAYAFELKRGTIPNGGVRRTAVLACRAGAVADGNSTLIVVVVMGENDLAVTSNCNELRVQYELLCVAARRVGERARSTS